MKFSRYILILYLFFEIFQGWGEKFLLIGLHLISNISKIIHKVSKCKGIKKISKKALPGVIWDVCAEREVYP